MPDRRTVVSTIVLAAGRGDRFGAPKQFALLDGRSLVWHAVRTATSVSDVVVLTLPEGHEWRDSPGPLVVRVGPTRAASVRCGVAAVPLESGVIAIHDAAHPLASRALFETAIAQVEAGAVAAAPVLPVTETLGHLAAGHLTGVVPRDQTVVAVQSPQVYQADVLRRLVGEGAEVRDEITLLVSRGYSVAVVPGDPRNVHVTTQDELEVAAKLLAER